MSMPGASSEMKDATEDTQRMCDQLKTKVEDMTKKTYEEFRAVKYRQQIVAGTNFFIKVHVGGESYLHLRVFQGLLGDGVAELVDVQEDRAKRIPLYISKVITDTYKQAAVSYNAPLCQNY